MKKLEKFANNKVLNLNLCVGGTVYQTCGEVSENCDDEAGSFVDGEYDDMNGGDGDCGVSVRNISTKYLATIAL